MKRRIWLILALAAVLSIMLVASSAWAQAQNKPAKSIQMEALGVETQIQRPEAVYFLPPADVAFETSVMRKSFVNKIKNSIEEEPF